MKFNLSDKLLLLRIKGFIVYVPVIFSAMMILLSLVDLAVDFFILGTFDLQRFIFQDFLINIFMSLLVAFSGWFLYGKRLKLKSNITEINLNENNGKKEK